MQTVQADPHKAQILNDQIHCKIKNMQYIYKYSSS